MNLINKKNFKKITKTMEKNTNYWKMKEATGKEEAIISILDVLNHNPLWLNKCTSQLFAVVYNLHTTKKRRQWLNMMPFEQVKELFIEIKKEYYNQTPIKF
jgi:hypothetical protein